MVVTVLNTLLVFAQEHLMKVVVIERTIFSGMAAGLIGNALMGSESWSGIGSLVCAAGLLAMFAGIAAYTLLDRLESGQ